MTTKTSRPDDQSTSDTMVWVSGGVFVVSCALLFLFIAHVVYHSLQTHWPRRIAVFESIDGTILAGELHGPIHDSQYASQELLLLKSGYRSDNVQPLSAIPTSSFAELPPSYPENIIALELRDLAPAFGLITKVTQLQHSLQTKVSIARVILSEIESLDSTHSDLNRNKNAFEQILPTALAAFVAQAEERIQFPIDKWNEAILSFEQIVAHNQALIRQKQIELSHIDTQLSSARKKAIKFAGPRSNNLINTIDEIYRVAFELGAADQAIFDVEASARFWKDQYQTDESIVTGINESTNRILASLKQQQESLQKELDNLVAETTWRGEIDTQKNIAAASTLLTDIANLAKSAYAQQLRIDTELAELDLVRNAFQIELALLDCGTTTSAVSQSKTDTSSLRGIVSTTAGNSLVYHWYPTSKAELAGAPLVKKQFLCAEIVRHYYPNQLGILGQLRLYVVRWIEFLFGSPRQNGVAGGVFPAIWGTMVMTILMSVMVMPFGVMAAIYMREYAQHSIMLSVVRITVNNLAGVPSIVYGVFGLAFFSYLIGGFIDGGPQKIGLEPLPIISWLILCAATIVSILWLAYRSLKTESKFQRPSIIAANRFFSLMLLIIALLGGFLAISKVPFFEGLYNAELPNPTFGKGCLLWASFTMALLTLPIVIVTTEEAISSVPASLKEGSYACGATKWQTIHRLVLPYARPGIITGMILSVARGAGEVAPLMLVGVIPLASDLPLDTDYPYLHGSRSFMHLGYHIYSLGLQNPDLNSARPMVYSTIMLLMLIVFVLNSCAIWLRSRINRQIKTQQF